MKLLLSAIVPPHGINDPAKLAGLVEAYEAREEVNPPVVLVFEDGYGRALSGSHRIAAMREVYDGDSVIDHDDPDFVLVSGEEVYQAILDADDEIAQEELERLINHRVGDFTDTILALLPYLPEEAQTALEDQQA